MRNTTSKAAREIAATIAVLLEAPSGVPVGGVTLALVTA
jgi:hypothetical protein